MWASSERKSANLISHRLLIIIVCATEDEEASFVKTKLKHTTITLSVLWPFLNC